MTAPLQPGEVCDICGASSPDATAPTANVPDDWIGTDPAANEKAIAAPAADVRELCATLLDAADWLANNCPHPYAPRVRAAADALSRLAAEKERLKDRIQRLAEAAFAWIEIALSEGRWEGLSRDQMRRKLGYYDVTLSKVRRFLRISRDEAGEAIARAEAAEARAVEAERDKARMREELIDLCQQLIAAERERDEAQAEAMGEGRLRLKAEERLTKLAGASTIIATLQGEAVCYREQLAAAQARIGELEKELEEALACWVNAIKEPPHAD
jgi:hypothetical protein